MSAASPTTMPEIASRVLRETQHPESGLKEAVWMIKQSLQAIDPSITGVGAVYDYGTDGRFNRLCAIMIDRPDQPMFQKASNGQDVHHEHPDRELLDLGIEFEASWKLERALGDKARPINTDEAWEPWEAVFHRTDEIVQRIEPLPAKTMAGLMVKARCVEWCHGGDEVYLDDAQTTDIRLVQSIISNLLAMGVGHV